MYLSSSKAMGQCSAHNLLFKGHTMKIAKISSLKHYIRWAQRERLNAKKEIRNTWNERNLLQGKNRLLIGKCVRNIRIFDKDIKEYRLWLKQMQSYVLELEKMNLQTIKEW